MVRVGYKYKIRFPKIAKDFFICSISARGRDGQWYYYSIMTNKEGFEDMTEDEEIEIKEITGIARSVYNNKEQVTIFAKIERIATAFMDEVDAEAMIDINPEDLPF